MIRVITPNYYLVLALFLVLISCRNKVSYQLSPTVVRFTTGSLNAKKITDGKFTIVRDKIKDGKLLLSATRSNNDSSFFIVIDIAHKRFEKLLKDPFNTYYATDFDISDQKAVFSSGLDSNIYLKDIKYSAAPSSIIKTKHGMTYGSFLTLNHDQLYLLHNVYGVAVVNIKDKKQLYLKDSANVNSPFASVASYPLNDSLNVLSGQSASIDKTRLYAIDSKEVIKWNYLIDEVKYFSSIDIINYKKSFVIAENNQIVALDKNRGHVLWSKGVNGDILKTFKIGDYLLISSIDFSHVFPGDNASCKIFIQLFDLSTGAVIWEKALNGANNPSIGICNNKLLFSDNGKFIVYDMYSGKTRLKTTFPQSEKNNYAFTSVVDVGTGTYYLKSYDDVYYW